MMKAWASRVKARALILLRAELLLPAPCTLHRALILLRAELRSG